MGKQAANKIKKIHWVDKGYPLNTVELEHGIVSYRFSGTQHSGRNCMILLHGIGSGSGSWAHTLSFFQHRYGVIAWDAPGYNLSTPISSGNPTALDYAKKLEKFCQALGVAPTIMVGHSWGAIIAGAYVAEINPQLPILILADPANGYGMVEPALRYQKLSDRLTMIRELGPVEMAKQRSDSLLSSAASKESLELVEWNMRKVTRQGYEQASNVLADSHLVGYASDYQGRVMVLCGEKDKVTPVGACRKISKNFRDARFRVLAGLGHASYVEGPGLFNNAVDEFL